MSAAAACIPMGLMYFPAGRESDISLIRGSSPDTMRTRSPSGMGSPPTLMRSLKRVMWGLVSIPTDVVAERIEESIMHSEPFPLLPVTTAQGVPENDESTCTSSVGSRTISIPLSFCSLSAAR